MLSVKTQDGWLPITVATNAYVEKDEEGEETLSFDVPPDSELFTYLKTEAEVRTEDNLYLIKGVNKLITQATITCELDMDDWKASYYLKTADIAALQTKKNHRRCIKLYQTFRVDGNQRRGQNDQTYAGQGKMQRVRCTDALQDCI